MRISRSRSVFEVGVWYLQPDTDHERHFTVVADALGLVQSFQPAVLNRMRKPSTRLLILSRISSEAWPHMNACVLSTRVTSTGNPVLVAFDLVHEAMHIRLWQMGIRYRSTRRERIERICTRAQIDLARQLPTGNAWVAHLQEQAAEPWWTDEALDQRRRDNLRIAGAPEWLVNLLSRTGPASERGQREP